MKPPARVITGPAAIHDDFERAMNTLLEAITEPETKTVVTAPFAPFTCIPLVAEALRPVLVDGALLLCVGSTGAGKSVFACQTAAELLSQGRRVRMISTELSKREVGERMVACHADWDYDLLKDGRFRMEEASGLIIPYDVSRSEAFTHRSLGFVRKLHAGFDFRSIPDFKRDTLGKMEEILAGDVPDSLILDGLQIDGLSQGDGGGHPRIPVGEIAGEVIRTLRRYAHDNHIPVLVTCQKSPDPFDRGRKKVGAAHISDFPAIGELADGVIGISQLRATGKSAETGCYAPSQFLYVVTKEGETLVPVNANFSRQRFEERVADSATPDRRNRAAAMRARSRYHGYVMFRRDVFERLCELRNPNCINVYALLLLLANRRPDSQEYGMVRYGRDKLAELSGLSDKQIRNAMTRLVKADLIRETKASIGRAKCREIVDFAESQDETKPGYFMLAYNLRDPGNEALLGNPEIFRAWLGLIHGARYSNDLDGRERGMLPSNLGEIAVKIGLEDSAMETILEGFVADGRIAEEELAFDEGMGFRIANYDLYQDGASYQADREVAVYTG